MRLLQALKASFSLLSRRERSILYALTALQMIVSLADLAGILLLGLVTAVGVSISTGVPLPPQVEKALETVGLPSPPEPSTAVLLATVAGLLLIGKSLASLFLSKVTISRLSVYQAQVSGRLASAVLKQPLVDVTSQSSQATAYALTTGLSSAVMISLNQAIIALSEVALLVVITTALLLINGLLTLYTIAFFGLIAFALDRTLSRKAGSIGRAAADLDVDSYRQVQEVVRSYRQVFVSRRLPWILRSFNESRTEFAHLQGRAQMLILVPKYVFEIGLVAGAGALAVSQLLTTSATVAIGTIVVFLAAGSRVVPSLLRLQTAIINITTSTATARLTYELSSKLLTRVDPGDNPSSEIPVTRFASPGVMSEEGAERWSDFSGRIELADCSYTYPGANRRAVDGVSLLVEMGGSLAIAGPTGAGKSTLADLILGLLDPDDGHVLLSGERPIDALDRWPGAIAYVPQETALIDGTVMENIAFGLPRSILDEETAWRALRRAHLASFVEALPEGIMTRIGENGHRMSGGQRQRLGLARALATEPRLIVLDEATSALDAETENVLVQALNELSHHVTTVTIAHRLATITQCDAILYMEAGAPTAFGTFDEVRRQSSRFDQQATLLGL